MKLTMWRVVVVLNTCTKFWGKVLHYEGKVKKTIFPKNFVFVLRTTRTCYMVRLIDFCFNFLANL